MKRIIALLSIFVLTAYALPRLYCQEEGKAPETEQQPDMEQALNSLLLDIDQLNSSITVYEDIELYDYEYQEASNRVKSFSVFVTKDSPLYETYDICNRSLYQIQKRIESLTEDYNHQQSFESLMERFQISLQQLSDYKTMAEQYANDGKADSLMMIKKKSASVYRKASMEYGERKDMVESDEALSHLWDSIEEYNDTIENLDCSSNSKLYELIFRVVMVAAVLLLVFNMLQSKLKAAKMTKTAKKQMEDVMGANDAPVL